MKFLGAESLISFCKYTYYGELKSTSTDNEDYYYCKTDFLGGFAADVLPSIKRPFILMSGQSDYSINEKFSGVRSILASPFLQRWISTNVDMVHRKLYSTPLGIAHSVYQHGNKDVVREVMTMNNPKIQLVQANISSDTNPKERNPCFEKVRKYSTGWKPFREHLMEMSGCYFIICPNGGGYDTHRLWESLYMKSVPVVTDNNPNIKFYRDLPMVRIPRWEDFDSSILSPELYNRTWNGFDLSELDADRHIIKTLSRTDHPLIP